MYSSSYTPNSQFSVFPPAVKHLLLTNIVMFVATVTPVVGQFLYQYAALWPLGSGRFEFWQLGSYMFLHGGLGHIFFNLFALWIFGQPMERFWGTQRFLVYYLICGLGAGVIQLFVSPGGPTVGASGAVYGLLLAFGMTFPNQVIMLLFPPIPIQAKYFVMIYGALELFSGLTRPGSGIAHFAHLGGMLVGFALIMYWRRIPSNRLF